jgi:hypothetical protein
VEVKDSSKVDTLTQTEAVAKSDAIGKPPKKETGKPKPYVPKAKDTKVKKEEPVVVSKKKKKDMAWPSSLVSGHPTISVVHLESSRLELNS